MHHSARSLVLIPVLFQLASCEKPSTTESQPPAAGPDVTTTENTSQTVNQLTALFLHADLDVSRALEELRETRTRPKSEIEEELKSAMKRKDQLLLAYPDIPEEDVDARAQISAELETVDAQVTSLQVEVKRTEEINLVRDEIEAKLRAHRARLSVEVLVGNTLPEDLKALDGKLRASGVSPVSSAGDTANIRDYQTKGISALLNREAAEPVAELLGLTAEVAVKRAKRRSLAIAEQKLVHGVCDAKLPEKLGGGQAFPNTCRLLQSTGFETLAGDPDLLRTPVTADVVGAIMPAAWKVIQAEREGAALFGPEFDAIYRASFAMAVNWIVATDPNAVADPRALLDAVLSTLVRPKPGSWSAEAKPALTAIAAVSLHLETGTPIPSLFETIDPTASADTRALAMELAELAKTAIAAEEPRDRIIPILTFLGRLSVEVTEDPATKERFQLVSDGLVAAIEGQPALAITNAASLAEGFLEARIDATGKSVACERSDKTCQAELTRRKQLRKATALLVAVADYGRTYVDKDEASEEDLLRKERQAALERFVDATTSRAERGGEWIVSLGVPVGFSVVGMQWRRERESPAARLDLDKVEYQPPQLQIPLGVALQRLPRPGKRSIGAGVHIMATAFDLGQFLAYDADGDIARPRWDSFVSPGLQAGLALGTAEDVFVIAPEIRYAPTLFSGTSELTPDSNAPGGALRLGLTVSYYVSLFDAN